MKNTANILAEKITQMATNYIPVKVVSRITISTINPNILYKYEYTESLLGESRLKARALAKYKLAEKIPLKVMYNQS